MRLEPGLHHHAVAVHAMVTFGATHDLRWGIVLASALRWSAQEPGWRFTMWVAPNAMCPWARKWVAVPHPVDFFRQFEIRPWTVYSR